MAPLTDKQQALSYLASVVREDIRRHEKSIERFTPKPGQPSDEAMEALARLVAKQVYRRSVLIALEAGHFPGTA